MDSARERLANEGILMKNPTTVQEADKVLSALRVQKSQALSREDPDLARLVDGIYKPIANALENNVPKYKKALNFVHEARKIDDAFESGLSVFNAATPDGVTHTAKELRSAIGNMSASERNYFRAGVLNSLFKGAQQTDQAANIIGNMNNKGTRDKLRVILDSDTYNELSKFMREETKFWKTYKAVQQAKGKKPQDIVTETIKTGGDVVRAGAWYSPFAFNTLAQGIIKKMIHRSNDTMYKEIIQKLASNVDPVSVPATAITGRRGLGAIPPIAMRKEDE